MIVIVMIMIMMMTMMLLQVQMTVYGHAITYGTIGTVVAGILAAFASKVLIQEIGAI